MMLQEAGEFANHLKKIEKDIRGLKNATEGAAGSWLGLGWEAGGQLRRANGSWALRHRVACLPLGA